MSPAEMEKAWENVSGAERKAVEAGLAEIAARFKKKTHRSVSDCYEHCADMEMTMLEFCRQMAGEAAAAACAKNAAHAAKACHDSCLDAVGAPHD